MGKSVLSDLVFAGGAKATGLPTPVNPSDAAPKSYVDAALEGLAWKHSCRVSAPSNLNLASPGATIDGVTMVAGDRVLVMNQTTASQNGIYVWTGATTPMTRSYDAQLAVDLEEATTTVEEGTSAGSTFRQTAVNFVLGTDPVSWTTFGTSIGNATTTTAGKVQLATQVQVDSGSDASSAVTPATFAGSKFAKKKVAQTIGDGSATQFDVTHNLGTNDVQVGVYRNSGSYDEVLCDISRPNTNTVRLNFTSAPAASGFNVVVIG